MGFKRIIRDRLLFIYIYIYIYNEVFNLKIDLVIKSGGKLMI